MHVQNRERTLDKTEMKSLKMNGFIFYKKFFSNSAIKFGVFPDRVEANKSMQMIT